MNIHYIRKSIPDNNLHLFLSNVNASQHVVIINNREGYGAKGKAYEFYSDDDSFHLAVIDSKAQFSTLYVWVD